MRQFKTGVLGLLIASIFLGTVSCASGDESPTGTTNADTQTEEAATEAADNGNVDTEERGEHWIADRHIQGQFFVGDASGSLPDDQINNMLSQRVKELTGITAEWVHAPGSSDLEVMTTSFMTGDVPEVIVSYLDDTSRPEWPVLKQAAEEGMFVNVLPLLEEADTYSKYLDEDYMPIDTYHNMMFNPDFDGAVYFMHLGIARDAGSTQGSNHALHMNMTAADAIGIQPEDITSSQELFEAAQAMLDAELNDRNGQALVPIGPTVWGGRLETSLYRSFSPTYNRDAIFTIHDDQAMHLSGTPYLQQQIEYIREGVKQNYIDPEIFTMSGERAMEHFMNGHYGFMVMSTWQADDKYHTTDTEWLPVYHIEDAHGNAGLKQKGKGGWLVWTISSEAENPEEIMAFADFLAGPLGKELIHYGVEGESFEYNEDSQPRILPEVMDLYENNPQEAINVYNLASVGSFWARIGQTDHAPFEDFGEWNVGDSLQAERAEHYMYVLEYSDPDYEYYDGAPAKSYVTELDSDLQRGLSQLLEQQYHDDIFVRAAIAADSASEVESILAEYRQQLEANGILEFEQHLTAIYNESPEAIYFE